MDKSMSKFFTKLILCPIIKQKVLNIDPINPEIFECSHYVHFFKDFQYKTFRDFLCFQIAPTLSIFEIEQVKM